MFLGWQFWALGFLFIIFYHYFVTSQGAGVSSIEMERAIEVLAGFSSVLNPSLFSRV
ncbi:MAG: hypothetical protein R2877_02970 [Bdellovibrionota bacterium]